MTTSAAILDQAADLFVRTRAGYRDGMIEVGCLLHEYVLACLREGDGLSEAERRKRGAVRSRAIKEAARRLGRSIGRVNELIRLWAAADLFGPDLGRLSYGSLRWLRLLIVRAGKGGPVRRTAKEDAGLEVSSLEQWQIRPEFRRSGPMLVRQAVAEGWNAARVGAELRALVWGDDRGGAGHRDNTARPPSAGGGCSLAVMAQVATPRDLAEEVASAVCVSPDPIALAKAICERLAGVIERPPRRKLTLAVEDGDDEN